jgi:hypothetical protein
MEEGKELANKKDLDIGISKYARDKVIDQLKLSFTQDLLEQDDFEKRIKIAVNTRNKNDLVSLVDDLPEMKEVQKITPEKAPQVHINRGNIKDNAKIYSILSGVERKGVWKPARKTAIAAVLGSMVLDYTRAELPPGVTEIDIQCILGSVEIYVPPGVNVENHCFAVLGSVEDKSTPAEQSHSTTLRITGVAVLGSMEIKPPKKSLMKRILKKLGLDD